MSGVAELSIVLLNMCDAPPDGRCLCGGGGEVNLAHGLVRPSDYFSHFCASLSFIKTLLFI